MSRIFTYLLLALFSTGLYAQQTGDEIFVLDLKIDGTTTTYFEGVCGFSAPDDWGGPVDKDACYPVVWGRSATDSLGCTAGGALVGNYTGKMVMLRRGVCNFSEKGASATAAGAAAFACANNASATAGDDCNQPGMGAGTSAALVTIPAVMFSRVMVNVIDAALKAGKTPEICFRRLSLDRPFAESAYAVPLSQADTLEYISMNCKNRFGADRVYKGKVAIVDPSGVETILESDTLTIMKDSTGFIPFANYFPATPMLGKYKMTYTTDITTAPGDTVYRTFEYTAHTFATDNFIKTGGISNNASFAGTAAAPKDSIYNAASLYKTGDAPFKAAFATFGINNARACYTGNSDVDVVNVYLHDADPNNDGTNELGDGSVAFDELPLVGFSTFKFDTLTPVDQDITVELTELISLDLQPNHLYYLRLNYDGKPAKTGVQLSLTSSRSVGYGAWTFDNGVEVGLVTPITLGGDLFSGWSGATIISRMHDSAPSGVLTPKADNLSSTKVSISPNPTADLANVQLSLDATNQQVEVSLISIATGRTVERKELQNVKEAKVSFETANLASGMYLVNIKTSQEGTRAFNVAICH
jgi:Secretion system C-terminal sorting domain/PA domain